MVIWIFSALHVLSKTYLSENFEGDISKNWKGDGVLKPLLSTSLRAI